MSSKNKVLEVKDLNISFTTDNGLVKAVRGVSFDLHEGETLCIVGESGSGKSVTSKAIMGILANNAIVESGSIMYEGENLIEVSEDEFHRIRGKKIGMIFQDPLSSLNPIVKIGPQITEAMLVASDKLKRMYDDLVSGPLVKYKNAEMKAKVKIEQANFACKSRLQEIAKDETLSKEQKQAASAAAKEECKKTVTAIKAKLKTDLPELKKNLEEAKKSAKAEVKAYKAKIQAKYKAELDALNEQLRNAASADDKAAINQQIKEKKLQLENEFKITKAEAKRRALEIMKEVGIPYPEKRFNQYPFEFSGGMRQRIVIAIALIAAPDILICDEPTTALDVTIQAQILELIKKIKRERKLSCIFITHDLGVVANMADRVAVMYAGKIVEYGTAEEVFFDPKHPYTWALLSSIPDVDSKERLDAIPGTPPNMIYPPKGDAFALRSKYAMKIDFEQQPPYFKLSDTHYAATWLLHENAPKVEMPKIVSERIKNALEGK